MRPFDWSAIFRPQWSPWEIALRAAIAYLFVQLVFRLVGRKELSRYSTYDVAILLLLSVAMRQSVVGNDTSLTSGIVALATIVGLDWLFSFLSFRSPAIARILEGSPRELVRDGRLNPGAMRRFRISRDLLLGFLREHGRDSLDEVARATVELSGRVSFVFRDRAPTLPP